MAGNWRKQVSKAVLSGGREHLFKLLQESAEPEKVRNLCVPLFGPHKYQKKWKLPWIFEDVVVEGSMSLLDIAAANGWVDVCQELVTKHGCTHETSPVTEMLEPDPWCKEGYEYLQRSPLSYAVKEGHVDVVAYLVRAFKLQISDDNEGRAFLAFAIINSQLEMVKYFVSLCEIDANKRSALAGVILLGKEFFEHVNNDTVSPFIIACLQCCDDIIKYLVTEGHCDPREECNWICGEYKISPVIAVAFKGSVELLKYVVNICNVCFFERDYRSSVPATCVLGDSEVIRFLIGHANIENPMLSDAKKLLMMSSVCSGLIDCVQQLCVIDIMALFFNVYRIPYVNEAARNGHFDVVKYLLEECAHEREQVSLFTMYAAASSGHLLLIKYFAEEQSDLFGTEGHHDCQMVVLHVAAGCGHLDVVKYLIAKYNLTLNQSDNFIEETKFLSLKSITTRNRIPSSDGGILHIAAERGHLNIVDYLIDKCNHDPNQTNSFSQTPLHFAAFNGHLPVVEHLLSASSRVSRDDDGNSPLHFACWQGHLRIVKCLIEQCKLDSTTTNRLSQSPLCLAVQRGHLPVVEYLADKIPIVDPKAPMDDKGNTALHLAAYGGHINMVEYVINNWLSNPNRTNEGSQTSLHVAVSAGYMHVAEYLIKEFPGVVTCTDKSVDWEENTALHIAVKRGSLNTIKYLINECKLDPYKINCWCETPVSLAVCGGHLPVLKCLLSECSGVTPKAPVDDKGNTALHIAVEHGSLSTVKYLINECKLNPYKINCLCETPVSLAVCGGHLPVVKCLLSECSGVTPEAPVDDKGNTALHIAVKHGSLSTIEYLINECKLDPNKTNLMSLTPLHVACCFGRMDVAEYLIKEFPGVVTCTDTSVDRNGNTALHIAVECGSLSTMKYLINECKLNPYKKNFLCETPVSLAVCGGHLLVVKCLLSECSGVTPEAPVDDKGNTALHIAVEHGSLSTIKYLINECKLSPYKNNSSSQTPVFCAIRGGHLPVVKYLLSECSGMTPEAPVDDEGNTALHVAVRYLSLSTIKCLINEYKLDPNKTNLKSLTPLNVACSFANMDVAEYLIEEFPGVFTCTDTSVDRRGNTALHVAVECGSLNTVKYLINECKLSPYKNNSFSQTPVFRAFCGGHLPVVKYLLSECSGVTPEAPVDDKGNTALHIAVEHGSLSTIKCLINEYKLDPNKTNLKSLTPFHVACSFGKMDVAEYLIKEFPGVVTCTDTSVDEKGNTALHIAVEHGSLSTIKYLINECKLDPYKKYEFCETPVYLAIRGGHLPVVKCLFSECPSVIPEAPVDDKGNTALHIAVQHGSLSTIKYLINECKLDPNKTNLKSLTPLHVACSFGKMDVAKYLIKEFPGVFTCTDTSVDEKGNTALHIAVEHGSLSTIKYLINECKLSPYKNNGFSQSPLFRAIRGGHLPVVKCLLSECSGVTPDAPVDDKGNTALHIAVEHGSLSTMKYLINECKLNPYKKNLVGGTPVYLAVHGGHLPFVKCLLSECSGLTQEAPVDDKGNTALHIAVEHGSLSTVKYLINECKLSPYKNNSSSQTPLFCAIRGGYLPVVKYLLSECSGVTPEAPVDDKGNTALHIAARYGLVNVLRYLTKECKLDPNQPNQTLSTSLHVAVAHNRLPVVRFLLDERMCHASSLNYHPCLLSAKRETSLVLITEYDVKNHFSLLASFSTFNKYAKLLGGIKSSFPVHSFTKVFLLGHPDAGKSTLAKNFIDLASRYLPPWFGQVSGVESHTAGIIPVTIQSRQLGNVVLYDLAGQPEFYSSHMAVLHKLMHECPAVFICVIDLSKSVEEVRKELRFWFNFIKMGSAVDSVRSDSQVVVAGSHADLLSSDVCSQKQRLVENVSRKFLVESFAGLVTLDCRQVSSAGLTSLKRLFLQAQETIRGKVRNTNERIPIFCHVLMEFLHKLKGKKDKSSVYSLTDLSQLIREENQRSDGEGILVSIPTDSTELHSFLSILNDRGLVLYLRGSTDEDSWIVVDEEALLSKVIGVLFAPEGFKEHRCIASNTGIATSSHITGLFPNIPPQVIIGMLKSLEFCKEIDPSHLRISNLSLEHSRGEFVLREGEKLLFFPSHVSTERPDKVWKIFQFCWYLICEDPHQFSMHFLHVLLLRLAFSFTKHCRVSWQIDEDSCTVWKNGIRWINENGIETVVEVLEHCTIVQLVITCPEGMMVEHCRHRSTLIREILALKQELCPSIELQEKFVLPPCLQDLKYPLPHHSTLSLLNIKSVAQCAVESSECNLFIGSLDSYRNLGESLIRSLFTKGDNKVSERDLFEIASAFQHNFQNRKNGCKVLGISPRVLENRLSELPSGERENPVKVCEELFLKWQAHDSDGGTYESLKRRFDMFSVFAGRNPLDLAEMEQPSLPVPLCESQQNSQSCKQ